MGVNGRQKGQTAERKLAKVFATWWGSEFARTPLSGGFATPKFRDDWDAAGDLVTPDKTFPFCVESKKVEGWILDQLLTSDKTKMNSWWHQTRSETAAGKVPMLVFTKNRAPTFVMMRQQDVELSLTKNFRNYFTRCFEYVISCPDIDNDRVVIFTLDDLVRTEKEKWIRE
jgi:hypothetical protein